MLVSFVAREPSTAEDNLLHTGANQAVRDLIATQTQTHNQRERRCCRLVLLCQCQSAKSWSPGPPSRGGTCPQWCNALSMMPAMSRSARAERFGRTASHGRPPTQESNMDFVFPPAMKRFRRQMLPVPAGGNVCCVLKRSSGNWARSPVSSPHKRAVMNTLLPQFSDFIPVLREFTIESRLCSISASCRCNGGGHPHVQGRTAQRWCKYQPAWIAMQ